MLNNDPEGYITIKGAQEIINKLRNTVRQAQARIYLSANSRMLELLLPELQAALQRGLKVVVIGDKAFLCREQSATEQISKASRFV